MKNIFLTIILFITMTFSAFADFDLTDTTDTTITLTIEAYAKGIEFTWSLNTEPDISRYILFKSINSLDNFTSNTTTAHPEHITVSRGLVRGNTYYWCIKGVDFVGNQSLPSNIAKSIIINSRPKFTNSTINL